MKGRNKYKELTHAQILSKVLQKMSLIRREKTREILGWLELRNGSAQASKKRKEVYMNVKRTQVIEIMVIF